MQKSRKRLALKIIFVLTVLLVGSAAIAPFIFSWRFEKIIERKLPEWVIVASDSLYTVSVDDIDINIFHKKLSINGIQLSPDSIRFRSLRQHNKLPGKVYRLNIETVMVTGVKWTSILTDKKLNCESLTIIAPEIYAEKTPVNLTDRAAGNAVNKKKEIPRFNIKSVVVQEPDIAYRNFDRDDSLSFYVKGGGFSLKDCIYDPKESRDLMKLFYAKSGNIHFDSLVVKRSNSLYVLRTDKIHFASTANTFEINNFNFTPALSNDEYYKEIGEQDEILTLKFPSIKLDGINWTTLVNDGELHIKKLVLNKPSVDVYISKIPEPAKKKIRRYPGQILNGVEFPLSIELAIVNDGSATYTELNRSTKQEGSLPFDHLDATISNISNIPEEQKLSPTCVASLKGQILESIIGMELTFFLRDSLGAFQATGYQTSLDGKKLNDITRPLAKMEMQSMNMNKLEFSLKCDGRTGVGEFVFLYDDLKLKILSVEEDGTLSRKGFMSFVLNKALLFPSNPMEGEAVRKVRFRIQRDIHRSFFNLLWTSVRTGALLTAGRNAKVADLLANGKPNNYPKGK